MLVKVFKRWWPKFVTNIDLKLMINQITNPLNKVLTNWRRFPDNCSAIMWNFVATNMNDIMETIEFTMNIFQIIDNGAFWIFSVITSWILKMAKNPFLRKVKVDSIQGFMTLSVKYWTDWISLFWSSNRFQRSVSDESWDISHQRLVIPDDQSEVRFWSMDQSEVRFWSIDQSKYRFNLKTRLIVQDELFLAPFFHRFDSSSCVTWSIYFCYNMHIMVLNYSLNGSNWTVIRFKVDGPKVPLQTYFCESKEIFIFWSWDESISNRVFWLAGSILWFKTFFSISTSISSELS